MQIRLPSAWMPLSARSMSARAMTRPPARSNWTYSVPLATAGPTAMLPATAISTPAAEEARQAQEERAEQEGGGDGDDRLDDPFGLPPLKETAGKGAA